MARGEEMNFFEAIFSFVFGDGDPNDDFDEKRWKMVSETCLVRIFHCRLPVSPGQFESFGWCVLCFGV